MLEDDASRSAPVETERSSSREATDPLLEERRALLRAQCDYWSARAHQTRLECFALERRLGLTPGPHTTALALSLLGFGSAKGAAGGAKTTDTLQNGALDREQQLTVSMQVPVSVSKRPASGTSAAMNGGLQTGTANGNSVDASAHAAPLLPSSIASYTSH